MAKGLVSREYLEEIANAIRLKRGTSEGTDTEVILSLFAASVEQTDRNTATIEVTDASGTTRASIQPIVRDNYMTYDDIVTLTPYGDIPADYYHEPIVDDMEF